MNKKLLIDIIVVVGIAVAIGFSLPFSLAVWIYLIWMVRKQKTNIFYEQMEPKLAESRLKRLKVFLLIAGISLAVGIVGVIMHNVIYGLSEIEESVFFFIALVGLWVFSISTSGGLVIFFKGPRKTT
jgi:hypothetical protein